MKILYAIQGTGNGHVARAREVIPALMRFGEVDVLLSGDQSQVELPIQPKFRSQGLTFIYNSKGGISYFKTLVKNDIPGIIREVRELPVEDYDHVINDFEFVSAWACRIKEKPCIGLGHQAALTSSWVPKPDIFDPIGKLILRRYAPVTRSIGFHFFAYDQNIYTPVIRSEVREIRPTTGEHVTVYLPAYSLSGIKKVLSMLPEQEFHVFSREMKEKGREGNMILNPIDNTEFLESLAASKGVLTSAGFETPAEAMFLGKKVAVIPIKGQLEQGYNAASLRQMGVPVWDRLDKDHLKEIRNWLSMEPPRPYQFKDQLQEILERNIFNGIRTQGMAFTLR